MTIELILIGLALSLLIYLPSVLGLPVHDDLSAIFRYPPVMDGNWKSQVQPLRPIPRVSWALTMKWLPAPAENPATPLRLFALHFPQVLFHWGSAILLAGIGERLGLDWAVVFFLFIVHPLGVNAVCTMNQRSSVLGLFWVLSGLGFFSLAVSTVGNLSSLSSLLHLLFSPLSVLIGSMFILAVLSKEDSLGVTAFVSLFHWRGRARLRGMTSDTLIRAAGIDGKLGLWEHFETTLGSSLKLVGWSLGFGLSTDHEAKWNPYHVRVATFLFILLPLSVVWFVPLAIKVAIVWFYLSPFVVYWFLPLADPIAEYRAYGTLPSIILLLGYGLQNYPLLFIGLMAAFAARSAIYSWNWSTPILYWRAAIRHGRALRSRVNLMSALQVSGHIEEASKLGLETTKLFPTNGILWANLAMIEEAKARQQYLLHCQRFEQTKESGPELVEFQSHLRLARERIEKAKGFCPDEPGVLQLYNHIMTMATNLKVS